MDRWHDGKVTLTNPLLSRRKDQNLLSPVNCWYLLLNQVKYCVCMYMYPVLAWNVIVFIQDVYLSLSVQVRRESKDHATLSDLYLNNVITRLTHISDDSARLLKRVSEPNTAFHLSRVTGHDCPTGVRVHLVG